MVEGICCAWILIATRAVCDLPVRGENMEHLNEVIDWVRQLPTAQKVAFLASVGLLLSFLFGWFVYAVVQTPQSQPVEKCVPSKLPASLAISIERPRAQEALPPIYDYMGGDIFWNASHRLQTVGSGA